MSSKHTPGPWRVGKAAGGILADVPIEGGPLGCEDIAFYGGYLIAESVAPVNRPLLAAAPEMYALLERLATLGSSVPVADVRDLLDRIGGGAA